MTKQRYTTTAKVVAAIRAAERALDRATDLATMCPAIKGDARAWKGLLRAGDLLNRSRLDLMYPASVEGK